jgi:predicted acetyltransferase
MTVPELETRMKNWLRTEYQGVLFEQMGQVVAYALYRDDPESIYLRQFFVGREHRCHGIGRAAIQILRSVWTPGKRVVLEVLAHNSVGHAFWKAAGFRDYAITLEMLRS